MRPEAHANQRIRTLKALLKWCTNHTKRAMDRPAPCLHPPPPFSGAPTAPTPAHFNVPPAPAAHQPICSRGSAQTRPHHIVPHSQPPPALRTPPLCWHNCGCTCSRPLPSLSEGLRHPPVRPPCPLDALQTPTGGGQTHKQTLRHCDVPRSQPVPDALWGMALLDKVSRSLRPRQGRP